MAHTRLSAAPSGLGWAQPPSPLASGPRSGSDTQRVGTQEPSVQLMGQRVAPGPAILPVGTGVVKILPPSEL